MFVCTAFPVYSGTAIFHEEQIAKAAKPRKPDRIRRRSSDSAAFYPVDKRAFVYTTFQAIVLPLTMMVALGILLRIIAHLFLLSARTRSCRLFSGTPWLPLSVHPPREDGECVAIPTTDGQFLSGSFFKHTTRKRKGVVLFCHELNGNRFGVAPYVESIVSAGFDLLTFDFHGHGESLHSPGGYPTPLVAVDDLADVRAAIDWIIGKTGPEIRIGVLGMGKGATIALCAAGSDPRVTSVILDGPPPERRLFEKNCWDALVRSSRSLVNTRSPRYVLLLGKAVLYTISCPFSILKSAWQRRILGYWCGCRFVNTVSLVKSVRQPIFIVHGNVESLTRADQIHAFRDRMAGRPRVWFVPRIAKRTHAGAAFEDCCRQITRFLADADN
ncbi:MAG TPA: hypothetical protein DEB39_11665 [Planctomycetaceae bacterium]|nr:hypothetical protein [Planctomycetaceae bacterium]